VTVHVVASTTETIRSGYLDPSASAVATIRAGDVVSYPETWAHWGNEATFGMSFAEREPFRHRYPNGPYSMMGPVEVQCAAPGDMIECSLLALRTRDRGWNSFPLGVGTLPHDFAEPYVHYFRFGADRTTTEYVQGITLPLAPFLGVMAVEPGGDDAVSAILAGPYGGNLVLRELTVGSSLFLPVAKPGGRVWVGDVHALQGDGVVDQTAIETAAEDLRIRYDLHHQPALDAPLAETATHWIGIGFADSLDDALVACLRRLIAWLHAAAGISEGEAYALCSMAVSFRVTQYASQTGSAYASIPPKAVHGLVPRHIFPTAIQQPPMTLPTEDRLDIPELLARADNAASRRDVTAYTDLFTDDAVLDGEKGDHRGRDALGPAVAAVWASEGSASVHLTLNAVIGPVDGRPDRATATSRLLVVDPGTPPRLRSLSVIVQHLEKGATRWRIARRSVSGQ
jgi:acetamidase/formamidase/ketosteroid isomerase-like protein